MINNEVESETTHNCAHCSPLNPGSQLQVPSVTVPRPEHVAVVDPTANNTSVNTNSNGCISVLWWFFFGEP